MEKDYTGNQENIEALGRIVESGSPLQHFAVNQMTRITREEAAARNRGEYEPKENEETRQPHIRTGEFFLQTQGGKFLYANLCEEADVIVLPSGLIPIAEFRKIVTEMLTDYQPAGHDDFNYVYYRNKDRVNPTPELFAEWLENRLILISKEPIISDATSRWGRLEIEVSDGAGNTHGLDMVTPSGEYTSYFIPWKSLIIHTSAYDLSWDGSLEKEKEFHSNKRSPNSAMAYAVVKNKTETKRLIPQFWQIIKRIIGDDKIVALSSKPGGMLPLTLGEAKRRYDVWSVISQKHMEFKGAKPELWDYEGEGFPIYYFSMGNDEFGILIDRSNSAYMIPYLFSKTKWYEKGVGIGELEIVTE